MLSWQVLAIILIIVSAATIGVINNNDLYDALLDGELV